MTVLNLKKSGKTVIVVVSRREVSGSLARCGLARTEHTQARLRSAHCCVANFTAVRESGKLEVSGEGAMVDGRWWGNV